MSSQISLTTIQIQNFNNSGMDAEAASLVVHQVGLSRTISMSTPCLVVTDLNELVDGLPVAIDMNMHTKTKDMQTWRRLFLVTFTSATMPVSFCWALSPTSPDLRNNSTHSLQANSQGNKALPCGSWRKQLYTMLRNLDHGISNFLILQVDSNQF